jgi:hypothetical protein
MKKPIDDISKPKAAEIRNLYLSYNHPLKGANIAKAIETGIR